jgi:hypothetical protein
METERPKSRGTSGHVRLGGNGDRVCFYVFVGNRRRFHATAKRLRVTGYKRPVEFKTKLSHTL